MSLSLSSQFISFHLPRFNHFPSLSLSLSTGAKQIAKYPQVVDFSDYVLRIAYHRTCQDEYRQSWMECKWSVYWGEQRRFRWALKLYCSYRGWTSTKFYRVIGFLFYYRGWGLRMNVNTTCYMTCYVFGVYHLIIEEGRISRLWKKNMICHIFYLLEKSSF